jgi:hypothetical protein
MSDDHATDDHATDDHAMDKNAMAENAPPEHVDTMPLDQFCQELSHTVRSVELIAVFRAREQMAGRNHDTNDSYKARFALISVSPTL